MNNQFYFRKPKKLAFTFVRLASLLFLMLSQMHLAQATMNCDGNILSNPDFENQNISAWEGAGQYAETGTDRYISVCNNDSNARQTRAATPGTNYSLSLLARRGSLTTGNIRIKFLSSSWQPIYEAFGSIVGNGGFQPVTINTTSPAGTAYVEVSIIKRSGPGCIDADDLCLTAGDGGGNQPDLNLANLINLPNSADAGSVVSFNFDLINSGAAMATGEYSIGAYLSSDSNFGNGDDVKVGEINTGNTPVGTISDVLGAITIPNNTSTGSYFLILVADDGEVISETDETNNFLSGNIFVNDGGGECAAPQITNTEVKCVTSDVTALVIEWNAVGSANSYELELTNLSNGSVISETVAGTSFLTTDFEFSTNYGLNLTAICDGGEQVTTSIDFGTADPNYDFFGLFQEANYFPQTNSVSVDVQIKNAGLAPGTVEIDYFLSPTTEISDEAILIDRTEGFVIGCVTGRSFFFSNFFSSLPANVSPGEYYIIAQFDPDNEFSELDETNNIAVSFNTITILGDNEGPTVTLTTPSSTVDGAFQVEVSFSESVTGFSLAEIRVTNGTKSNAEQINGSTYRFTVTPTITQGIVSIVVVANSATNSAGQGNQRSNQLDVNFRGDGNDSPDLFISSVILSQYTADAGGQIGVFSMVENLGGPINLDIEGGYALTYFLSTDRNLSSNDVQIENIPEIRQLGDQRYGVMIPSNTADGEYYIIVQADRPDEVAEENENNNSTASDRTITIGDVGGGDGVDLELTASSSNNNPTNFAYFPAEFTVTNKGDETASNISIRWVNEGAGFVPRGGMEADASQGSVNPVSQNWNVGSLAAGASATITLNYFNLNETAKKVWAEVQSQSPSDIDSEAGNGNPFVVNEDDEALIGFNGDGGGDAFDLEMTNLQAPEEVQFNTVFTLITVGQVTNVGTAAAPASTINVYISKDDQFDPDEDAFFAAAGITALEPGADQLNAPQTDDIILEGTFDLDRNHPNNYWIAVVSSNNSDESNVSNNIFTKPFTAVVPNYDVAVKANTPPPTMVEQGQLYDLDFEVNNLGDVNYSITIFDKGGSANSVLDIATSPDLNAPAVATLFSSPWFFLPFRAPEEMLIPDDLADGEYYLRWYVASNLTEVTKENNVLTFPITVGDGGGEESCAFDELYPSANGFIQGSQEVTETVDGFNLYNVGRQPFAGGNLVILDFDIDEEGNEIGIEGSSTSVLGRISSDRSFLYTLDRVGDEGFDYEIILRTFDNDVIQTIGVTLTPPNATTPYRLTSLNVSQVPNGYVISHIFLDETNGRQFPYLFKVDNAGNTVYEKAQEEVQNFGRIGAATATSDGGVFVRYDLEGRVGEYRKFDASGDFQFSFGRTGDLVSSRLYTPVESPDGQFLYVPVYKDPNPQILKYNATTGALVYDVNPGNLFSPDVLSFFGRDTKVLPLEDGGAIVTFSFSDPSSSAEGVEFGKLDAAGNLVWARLLSTDYNDFAPKLEASDGSIVFTGIRESQLNILKTTSLGLFTPLCNPIVTDGVDLELSLSANNENPGIYNNVTITTTISNTGTEAATDILIYLNGCDPNSNSCCTGFNQGFDLVYANTTTPATAGIYDFLEQTWTIPSLGAGESATLEVTLFTLVTDPKNIFAKVMLATGDDVDSTPGNNFGGTDFDCQAVEDDEADLVINSGGVANRLSDDNRSAAEKHYNITQNLDYKIHKTFPTLTVNEVTVMIFSKKETQMDMVIYDMQGQEVQKQKINIIEGPNRITLNVNKLSSGMHNIIFSPKEGMRGKPLVTRFVKQSL